VWEVLRCWDGVVGCVGGVNRNEQCMCVFSTCIQPYPTYLSTLKICRVMLKLYTE